ncbi:MAG: UDP-glucose 4-epimerase GalE [Candidatus Limnocylindrales bacterium]
MRILVTGGAGYVGSVTVEALQEAGNDVVVLDDLSTGHRGAVVDGATLEIGSYGNPDTLARLLDRHRIEAVLHCAAKSQVAESVADPAKYYRENVVGGVVLLEGMRLAGVGRIVFSSTAAVYGMPQRMPITEDDPPAPISPYGETKRTFEEGLRWYGQAYGLRSVIFRYFNVAGASTRNGEAHSPETHLIPNVLAAAESGGELTIFGGDFPTPDGTCIRDYIHVLDLAQAHLLALEATDPSDPRTGSADGPCAPLLCNLGTGSGFSNREVVSVAERIAGRAIRCRIGSPRPGDPAALIASPARARELLGWRPAHESLEAMVGSAWEWRRSHPRGYVPEVS